MAGRYSWKALALTAAGLGLAAAVPAPGAPADQDPGEAIYRGKGTCFACHGPEAKGTALAPDLTDDAWVNFEARPTVEEVAALVKEGVARPVEHPAPMPPMGGARLSEEEIGQVARYVLSLSATDG
jgi:mono/diheme cytochrome c family protein